MPAVSTRPATVVILDFGAQYSQLIARRAREARVYSELLPHDTPWSEIEKRRPAAIILTGGPESTLAPGAPGLDPDVFASGLPILGICYGMQLIARDLGGELVPLAHREFGPAQLNVDLIDSSLFLGVAPESHTATRSSRRPRASRRSRTHRVARLPRSATKRVAFSASNFIPRSCTPITAAR
jgi:GMP synthase (glutamine-hydrolysing) A subunit